LMMTALTNASAAQVREPHIAKPPVVRDLPCVKPPEGNRCQVGLQNGYQNEIEGDWQALRQSPVIA